MHLKTLTLRGFKSFAGTTVMRLEPGITCVVGPNGSGKSNVVDALAWVMGEQGAKTLRGGNMADVIFAGTSTRPALGRAQVELTIDNTDGHLPIEYSEVTISRTLFRGGGSEYSINGTPARLLDIQELLSDTGMGRQMHVIVGQGQLDAILSSTPEERRGFIEEAAGVLKHRRRKERALKKLADMDANLVRVLDLTNEIHRQLGPLARQAKAARRAHRVQAAVRDARARILADDIVRAQERLDAQSQDDEALKARIEAISERAAALRSHRAELEVADAAVAPETERWARAWQRAMTVRERLNATLMAAQERIALHSRALEAPTGEDPDELDRRAEEATAQDAELLAEVDQQRQALQQATAAKTQAEAAYEAAARDLARANRSLADYREKVARVTGDVASAHSRFEAATAEAERAADVLAQALARQKDAEEQLPEETAAPDSADSPAAQACARAQQARDQARAAVDELLDAQSKARADRASWESRRDALAQSLTPEDATAQLRDRPGVIGQVPTFVKVAAGKEDAIAALLSPYADAVVVESADVAIEQLRRSRAESTGRIRMMIAEATPSAAAAEPAAVSQSAAAVGEAAALPDLPAGAHWALDMVTIEPAVRASVEKLLRGTVVCEDLDQIDDILATPGVTVVATARAEIVAAGWASGQGAASSSPLTLHAHYDEAVAGTEAARQRENETESRLVVANAALDEAIRTANLALQALRAEDAERAQAAQERARLASAAQATAAEAGRARAVAERAADQVEWARQRLDEARERLEATTSLAPPDDVADARKRADEAATTARSAREAETAARLELRAAEERSRHIQARARSLRQNAAKVREESEAHRRREAARLAALAMARDVAEQTRLATEFAARVEEVAARARDEAAASRSRIGEELAQVRRHIDAATDEENQLREAAHRDEIARAELRVRLEQAQARALEELSVESDALIEEFGPHVLAPANLLEAADDEAEPEMVPYVREHQEQALARAQRELTRLGKVNPLALEEHAALAKRHEFLVSQVQDLKKSKADLLRIVDDVDRLVQEAFASAWHDTAEHFEQVFTTLFPGGMGRLRLTDPDDMLGTGIEIEARPAGKRVKRLSLLSGGERSLAALAFLIAIFHARPSPFYVMDEVEAALDDVNLSRLIDVFRQLQETSQLIVVTHQKRTMEIADALYGVTMREGVTRVVSQRLGSA